VDALALTTRIAEAEDEPFLRQLFSSVCAANFSPLKLAPEALTAMIEMQYRARRMHYMAAFPDAECKVILANEEPVGSFTVSRDGALVLVDISLLPRHRNQGFATRLITELQQEGSPIELTVDLTNPAKRLYERLGFEETSQDEIHASMRWEPPSKRLFT
jgi:ribosomal protein S18 acetylase RimI-like enzyme